MAISAANKAKVQAEKIRQARLELLGGKTTFLEPNWDRAAGDFLRDGTYTFDLAPGVRLSIAYAYLKSVETGTNPAGIVLADGIEITRRGDDTASITLNGQEVH